MSTDQTRVVGTEPSRAQDATVVQRSGASGIHAGTILANTYRVIRLLGGGGMGDVYEAKHLGLGTTHAVKVIRPTQNAEHEVMELFYREAKVLRGVRHDAVVSYDGFVRDAEGRDYLVMEYVSGSSLGERLDAGPLPPDAIWALRDRLAAGLDEAHRKGAVHRDISPDNVILPDDRIETAKLIDFGLCKLTDPGQHTIIGTSFAGKFRYAAPEQFGLYGGVVDPRTDIYSLGLVLAAAARGKPLDMGTSFESAIAARRAVPPLEDVPADLREWLTAMLQPDPARRPASMHSLLETWPAAGGGGSAAQSADRKRTATARLLPAAAVALVLALGAAGTAWWLLQEPQPEPVPAPTPVTTEPNLAVLVEAGRLDEAFAMFREQVQERSPPAMADSWALAQALQGAGMLDPAFAVSRELALRGHGPAALAIAEMYDPRGWNAAESPFSRPNVTQALEWYARAAAAGIPGADAEANALQGWVAGQ